MSGLEIITSDHQGFKPVVDFGSWRTAIANASHEYQHKEITVLSRHLETDELFVLLKGSCMLITADNGESPGEITKTWMESGTIYNVTKGTWHGSIMLPGSTNLIVENRDTGEHNSQTEAISEKISL